MDVLNRDERIPLSDSVLDGLQIDITYKFKRESFSTTTTAFVCDESDSVIDQTSFVSYMNYKDANSVVQYLGCNGINGESFKVVLKNMPQNGKSIHFILSSDSPLIGLKSLSVTLRDMEGERIATFSDITIEADDTAVILLEFRLSMNKQDFLLTPKSECLGKYEIDRIFSDLGVKTIS